jgi:hypothetical protein
MNEIKELINKFNNKNIYSGGYTGFKGMQHFMHIKNNDAIFWHEVEDNEYIYCIFKKKKNKPKEKVCE